MPALRSHKLFGAVLMGASVLVFVLMNSLTKACPLPSAEKVFFRMALGVIAVFALVRLGWARFEFNSIPLLSLRGVLGALAVLLYFYSIDKTSLGRAVFYQFTYPAWGALFSYVFLKEKLGWTRLPALAATFAGVYFIAVSGENSQPHGLGSGDVSGILCGLFSGAAVTTIRACHKYDSTHMIFLFFASFGAVFGAAVTFSGNRFVEPSHAQWALLAAIGVTGTIAQLFLTSAYRYLDVTAAGSIATLQAPLSSMAGVLFFEENLGARFVVGAALILIGAMYLAVTSRGEVIEHVHEKPPS